MPSKEKNKIKGNIWMKQAGLEVATLWPACRLDYLGLIPNQ